MPYKDKEKNKLYQREWARKNKDAIKARRSQRKDKIRAQQRHYWRRLRLRIIDKLGGVCVYCGCDNQDALEINHINGKGNKYNRRHSMYLDIIAGRYTEPIELTCGICNTWHKLVKLRNLPDKWTILYHK